MFKETKENNASFDSYFYKGSNCLKNLMNIHDMNQLQKIINQRVSFWNTNNNKEYLLDKHMTMVDELSNYFHKKDFTLERLKTIHHIYFNNIYSWSGQLRTCNFYSLDMDDDMIIDWSDVKAYLNCICEITCDEKLLNENNESYWRTSSPNVIERSLADLMAHIFISQPFMDGNAEVAITYTLQFADSIGYHLDREMFKLDDLDVVQDLISFASNENHSDDLIKRINESRENILELDDNDLDNEVEL